MYVLYLIASLIQDDWNKLPCAIPYSVPNDVYLVLSLTLSKEKA